MDTGTHFVMGITLGGLAISDPVVAQSTETAQCVLIATVIGSQAPDIDTILKIKNNAVYIRNHRGITHSIPAIIIWPLLIIAVFYPLFPEANLFHLWIWTFLSVFLHVFVDIFNSYGTQALRPFSKKWIALGWINTFDPIIFVIHSIGIIGWLLGGDPRVIFPFVYTILILYYLLRYFTQQSIYHAVQRMFPDAEKIIIAPTIRFFQWRIAVMGKTHFFVARAYRRNIVVLDKFTRFPIPDTEVMRAARKDSNIAAFLSFSPIYRWEVKVRKGITEVKFIDLRYRSNDHYPFVAIVHLDENLKVISSYTGWIFDNEKLKRKLNVLTN